ncbi:MULTISPECIES: HD domain-containing phosphohydrolase [Romboutsia]|uniref:PAS domain S-box/diguanylate cyclase (GGDEF) domain-containing protein n=1 Tax=Romboutsia hominis TaxID=1507512 RepID=A0A2P2BUW9_9FIRM|nr:MULTISPECIES: HD domain-containing phosphohydrolase [Romboutsia]MCH1959047.1 diguanylate cyclase [Romboutsia hominis]MCH1968169.1 diguanylate cyclase [Romboutsia hominis]MDB8805852.1 diguanylate cyclase [Romboutsia sp. 1001216sp1]MDB8808303.1 diguanylate cyclase [Romboutsia sp. 1001216sp1]MDB8811605.1 diguanylate cyclase [Romboutsia sp. 1001216sp1]
MLLKTEKEDTQTSNNIIMDNIPFPIWIKNLDGKLIATNKAFKHIYNFRNNEDISVINNKCLECSNNDICNEDFKSVIMTKEPKNFEVCINGKFSQCYVTPYINEYEEIIGVMGMLIDITPLKEEQSKLEERENILRTIIDTLPQYIFYKDRDSKYIGYNKKWKEHYDALGIGSMIGKNDIETQTVSEEVARGFMEEDKAIIESKKMKVVERRINGQDGREIIEETIKVPVIDEQGQVWGIVGISSDVTEKTELKEKLMKLSFTDSLTGVYNRACFEEKKEELNNIEHLPIGVIMGDVNGLKVINDTFGHLEGDRLLKEMAKILKSVTREEDFIFRWGGDEFVILIPNCDEQKCEEAISKIIDECEKGDFNLIDMSISLGSSIKNCLGEDIYTNLQEAEEKLYRQKLLNSKSVRNSIIFSLNKSLQEKNLETEQHTQRLTNYAIKIGKRLGFTTAQLDELELVTKLHDIGKIGISEEILLKKGKLTEDEFNIIKSHTEKGYRILQTSSELSHVAIGILAHHERYDGKGYPLGLRGEEIPIMARIVNIVDSYDAMTNDRGYNIVKNKEDAIKEMMYCRGTQFDPKITDIFIDIISKEK